MSSKAFLKTIDSKKSSDDHVHKNSDHDFQRHHDLPEVQWQVKPDFIYGGPFIKPSTMAPFMDSGTPINLPLQGTFKKSFAYISLKDRMPEILTKVIDYCSREEARVQSRTGATDDEIKQYMKSVAKLKNEVVTNKTYAHLTVDTEDAKKWNEWIDSQDQKTYFTNTWLFTECYIYRRLRECAELIPKLNSLDPFELQKEHAFNDSLETMCLAADTIIGMLNKSSKEQRKADFITLLKLCLWSNKCDLSLSAGSRVNLQGATGLLGRPPPPMDPFQMIIDLKDKLLVDDTAKIADAVISKADAIAKNIAAPPTPPSSPSKISEKNDDNESIKDDAPEKIPCPAKMTVPQSVMFDIICDNSGYELFTDLCLAHFLIAQEIVQKVRFHVKKIPWFVSDVTLEDFVKMLDWCSDAAYKRTVPSEGGKGGGMDLSAREEKEEAERVISSENLRLIGTQWAEYLLNGTFQLMAEDYWVSPHAYKDMKRLDYNMYRKLQFGCAILFKGDLNFRKLLAERNCNPYLGFEAALQGFTPAPVIAVRTVKSELICGLPKGKYDALTKLDPQWMEKGDYGVIQFCGKGEALKPSDRPCDDYGVTCFGTTCPVHTDM